MTYDEALKFLLDDLKRTAGSIEEEKRLIALGVIAAKVLGDLDRLANGMELIAERLLNIEINVRPK